MMKVKKDYGMRLTLCLMAATLALSMAGCSSTPQPKQPADSTSKSTVQSAQSTPATVPDESVSTHSSDDRGISGMKSFPIRTVLSGEPFAIPYTDDAPAPIEASEIYVSSCISSGSNTEGVLYDYSITLDGDDEIIGASFGLSSTTATEDQLLLAADLFFYGVAINPYDTGDAEGLGKWFSDNLPSVSTDGTSTTIGDATFELYGDPGLTYWVSISKAV